MLAVMAGCSGGSGSSASGSHNGPVDAVNNYVNAADGGDVAAVEATLCKAQKAQVAGSTIRDLTFGNASGTRGRDHAYTLTIGTPTIAGDAADVPVAVTDQKNGQMETTNMIFHVVREDGIWLTCGIDESNGTSSPG